MMKGTNCIAFVLILLFFVNFAALGQGVGSLGTARACLQLIQVLKSSLIESNNLHSLKLEGKKSHGMFDISQLPLMY